MPTRIEWAEESWNPVTGCTQVSPGCAHCYALRIAERGRNVAGGAYEGIGFDLTLRPERLDKPKGWRKPRVVFVNSMSDLFHDAIPDDYIRQVFATMAETPRHTYLVLTKRPERMAEFRPNLLGHLLAPFAWPANVWAGVSVESARWTERIYPLEAVAAPVRFLSCEPLLGPIPDLPLGEIGWCIVGGESGPKARPMAAEWAREIRDQCEAAGVAFFFKQWGEYAEDGRRLGKGGAGRRLDGRLHDDRPPTGWLP